MEPSVIGPTTNNNVFIQDILQGVELTRTTLFYTYNILNIVHTAVVQNLVMEIKKIYQISLSVFLRKCYGFGY